MLAIYIDRGSDCNVGLFGFTSGGAEIKNVQLVGFNISGYCDVGSLVGRNEDSTISNCTVIGGSVIGSYSRIGGLAGRNYFAGAIISQCYTDLYVSGEQQTGGLVGAQRRGAKIYDSYALGDVSGTLYKIGGLVGDNMGEGYGTLIKRCYSAGHVSGTGGGLVGYNWKNGTTQNSYWDKETSGKSSSYGGTGKTTDQMMQQATFVNWETYPYLIFEYGELVSLEITGPEEVADNFQMQYRAMAHYDNNSTRDVTDSADWVVEPNMHVSIEGGQLTTEGINRPQEDITIYAQYTVDTNSVEAEKAVTIFAVCPTGSALEFDGDDDYVSIPDSEDLDFRSGDSFSISLWVRYTTSGPVRINQKYDTNSDNGYGMFINTEDFTIGTVSFRTWSGGTPKKTHHDGDYNDGSWHFVVGVRDQSVGKMYLYVDGIKHDEVTEGIRDLSNTGDLRIGTFYGASGRFFEGDIDDVRIYNRVLSAEEIRASMHTRLTGVEPGLVGYWDFDEGEGQVVYDLSSNGNLGYLGSDPCETDSDPAWIESDAPIGICTIPQLIERNITDARETKLDILEELEAALMKEDAAISLLDGLFRVRDYSDFGKNDIVKAKQEIHSAVQREERAETTIDKSIEDLEDSLRILGNEVDANRQSAPQSGEEAAVISADINGDGVVDFGDFNILSEQWLKSNRDK
ncbi:MAG: LamG domain-containing protein [Planctomycetota bacterium]|jgi:hypothetical protein